MTANDVCVMLGSGKPLKPAERRECEQVLDRFANKLLKDGHPDLASEARSVARVLAGTGALPGDIAEDLNDVKKVALKDHLERILAKKSDDPETKI